MADERKPRVALPVTWEERLNKIAEMHCKHVDEHGGTTGDCNECGWPWPCPTYRWATEGGIDANCTWELDECSYEEHGGHLDGDDETTAARLRVAERGELPERTPDA